MGGRLRPGSRTVGNERPVNTGPAAVFRSAGPIFGPDKYWGPATLPLNGPGALLAAGAGALAWNHSFRGRVFMPAPAPIGHVAEKTGSGLS